MPSIEYQGLKVSGGKAFAILTLLGALGSGAWAVFNFYSDYLSMKEQILLYTEPDLSGIEERLSLLEEKTQTTNEYVSEIRNDLKDDIRRTEDIAYNAESFAKDSSRELQDDMKSLKQELELMIDKALNNPLNNMKVTK
jgi:hypothetical protein